MIETVMILRLLEFIGYGCLWGIAFMVLAAICGGELEKGWGGTTYKELFGLVGRVVLMGAILGGGFTSMMAVPAFIWHFVL